MPDDIIQQEENNTEQLQKELDDTINLLKRTAADFENYKRRKETENKELLDFAKEVTVVKLLPAIDTLEQALKHMPEMKDEPISESVYQQISQQYRNWQQGMNGIVMQLDKVLEELGVKKIEAVGKKFDPNFHEAVKEVESEAEDGTVVEEFQTGFELNGKVIRPSQVVISKKAAP